MYIVDMNQKGCEGHTSGKTLLSISCTFSLAELECQLKMQITSFYCHTIKYS